MATARPWRAARLINVADLSAPFELTRQTIHEYVTLLEHVFLLERLPSWHTNRLSRLVKRSKLHMGDTGVACSLLGIDAAGLDKDRQLLGSMLETFVLQELRRQASSRPEPAGFFHFRDRDDTDGMNRVKARWARRGLSASMMSFIRDK